MSNKIYQTILISGLFHDIGKLIQSGDFDGQNVSGKNSKALVTFIRSWGHFLVPWVDLAMLETLLMMHNEPSLYSCNMHEQNISQEMRSLCLLLRRADKYSSNERFSDEVGSYLETTPLTSVFSNIKLKAETKTNDVIYDTVKFSPENAFPRAGNDANPSKIASLVKDFGKVMEEAGKAKWPSFRTLYTHLINIMSDYCWCIPADSQEGSTDISLYDHLRTTAAIVAAAYKYHEDHKNFNEQSVINDAEDKFILLAGDLSGIQRYIFDIADSGVKGVAKRLRARSFYLTAIAAGIAHKIVHDLDLPPVNITTMSGGNFYILLPNTSYVQNYVDNLRLKVNQDFLDSFAGELSLNLAAVSFAGQDFRHYNKVQRQVGEKLSLAKLNPLKGMLHDSNGIWLENNFVLDKAKVTNYGYCESCRKMPAIKKIEDGNICALCDQDLKLGKMLPQAKMILFYNHNPQNNDSITLPGELWTLLTNKIPATHEGVIAGYCFGGEDTAKFTAYPVSKAFWSNYVPNIDGVPFDFDTIAKKAAGKKMLGVVKADVDNLGALFSLGLGDRGTISRVATLSRMLETFFTGWLNHLLVKKYPNVYLVYSGGDDLLAVGPWDQTTSLISQIREDFIRFIGKNPDITLSAGIAVIKPSFPIFHAVAAADENLDKAKNKALKAIGEAKDQCTLLGETVKWGQLPMLLDQGRTLADWLDQGFISTRFVHHLLLYARMFDHFLLKHKIEGLKYIPLLNYDINRNVKNDENTIEIYKWAQSLADINSMSIRHLALIARYALLARRVNNA